MQIAVPEATKREDVAVDFEERSVGIKLAGMQPVALPHPAVKPPLCTWTLGRKTFHGGTFAQLCIHFELEKAEDALWPQNTFGGGGDEVLAEAEEIEAAWAAPQAAETPRPDPASKEWSGEYTWRQEQDRVAVWFDVPEAARAKDVRVTCAPERLTVELAVASSVGRYVRTLAAPVLPDEMTWQFDDDLPGKRRLRVEVAMRDLASWENGPFLPEDATPGKGYNQHSWSEPKQPAAPPSC